MMECLRFHVEVVEAPLALVESEIRLRMVLAVQMNLAGAQHLELGMQMVRRIGLRGHTDCLPPVYESRFLGRIHCWKGVLGSTWQGQLVLPPLELPVLLQLAVWPQPVRQACW